jgi:hypothetical protein
LGEEVAEEKTGRNFVLVSRLSIVKYFFLLSPPERWQSGLSRRRERRCGNAAHAVLKIRFDFLNI